MSNEIMCSTTCSIILSSGDKTKPKICRRLYPNCYVFKKSPRNLSKDLLIGCTGPSIVVWGLWSNITRSPAPNKKLRRLLSKYIVSRVHAVVHIRLSPKRVTVRLARLFFPGMCLRLVSFWISLSSNDKTKPKICRCLYSRGIVCNFLEVVTRTSSVVDDIKGWCIVFMGFKVIRD